MKEVRSRADRREFLRLPWKTQRTDPNWVPPLLYERAKFVDRGHPFLAHGAATLLIAHRGKEPIGRILVSDDPRFNELWRENLGNFGLFECIRDQAAADALLEAAADWLRSRGRTRMVGPIDYSIHYQSGLLVEGFEFPPRFMMNHNPPWYAELLESWGLKRSRDLLAWSLDLQRGDAMPARWRSLSERLESRNGISIRPARKDDYDAEVLRLKSIYNKAWAGTWGFVPMSDAEFDHLAHDLRSLVIPELLLFAEVRGRAVGFAMSLPDLNEAIRPLNGRLTTLGIPVGLARLAWRLKTAKRARMLTLGVLPEWRGRGICELLILRSFDAAVALGFQQAELGWTADDNRLINGPIEAVGATAYKRYRIYERDLDGSSEQAGSR